MGWQDDAVVGRAPPAQASWMADEIVRPAPTAVGAAGGGGASAATEPDVPPVAPTFGDRVGRQLNLGTRAVGRGLADTAGFPIDIAKAVANVAPGLINNLGATLGHNPQVPYIEHLPGDSEGLKRVFGQMAERLGMPAAPPQEDLTGPEKLIGHVGEMATSFLAPAALSQRMAGTFLNGGKTLLEKLGVPTTPVGPGTVAKDAPLLMRPYATALEDAGKMAPGAQANAAAARPVLRDTAAGAGAGVAEDAIDRYKDTPVIGPILNSPIGHMLATMFGGAAGAHTFNAVDAARRGVSALPGIAERAITGRPNIDPATGESPRISDMAARALQDATTDPSASAATIRTKNQQYRDAGISPPTAGLMSEDSGLIGIEKGLRVNADTSKDFNAADLRTRTSAAQTLDDLKPNADPRYVTDMADRVAAARRKVATDNVDIAQGTADATDALAQSEGGALDLNRSKAPAASTKIDETLRADLADKQATKNNLYAEAKDVGADVPRDIAPFQEAADNVRAAASKLAPDSEILPKDFFEKIDAATKRAEPQTVESAILDAEGKPITREQPGENPSYRDIAGLRPALSGAIAKARAANQGAMVDALVKLKTQVEAETGRIAADAAKPGADPKLVALSEKIAAAEKNYKENYAPDYVKGEGGKFRQDIARDPTGTATEPTQTAGRFLTIPEKSADLARILSTAKDPAAAKQGVRDYLFSQVAKDTLDGNKVNELRLNKWLADNKDILASHPEVAKELRDLQARVATNKLQGSAAEAQLAKAKAGLDMTEKQIQDSGLGLMLGKDPHNAVEAVFASNDPAKAMQKLTQQFGGKDSKTPTAQSWKRAVSDWVEQKVTNSGGAGATTDGSNTVSLAKLGKTADRFDETLSQVFSPKEMNSIQMVRKAVTDMSRLAGTRSIPGPGTAEDVQKGLNVVNLIARFKDGALKGGADMAKYKLILRNLGLMDEGKDVGRVLSRAMNGDPELAAHLLERPVTKADRSLWNRRLNTLMGIAASDRQNEKE